LSVLLLLPLKKTRKYGFEAFYLVSTFTLIVAWRLSALAHMKVVVFIYLLVLLAKLLTFIGLAFFDIRHQNKEQENQLISCHLSRFEWHLLFFRILIGFILIPHFCEKLFAGSVIRLQDVQAFTLLGVPHPEFFVILAGLCEFAGAFSIGCGFLTRFGSLGLSLYLIIATLMGGHQHNGFIWASQGGGWEYPFFWVCLMISFVFFGSGCFSIDYLLKRRFKVPQWIRYLMGGV